MSRNYCTRNIGQNGGIITQLMNWIQQLLVVSIAKLLLDVIAKMEQLDAKRYPPYLDIKQKKNEFDIARRANEDGSVDSVGVPKLWEFDYYLCRKKLATMIPFPSATVDLS